MSEIVITGHSEADDHSALSITGYPRVDAEHVFVAMSSYGGYGHCVPNSNGILKTRPRQKMLLYGVGVISKTFTHNYRISSGHEPKAHELRVWGLVRHPTDSTTNGQD